MLDENSSLPGAPAPGEAAAHARLASEADPRALLTALLDEAVAHLGADAGSVHRWDERQGGLMVVCNTLLVGREPVLVPLGQGAIGQAAARRAPVVVDDYARASNVVPAARDAGVRAAIAVPLLHQNRLFGALGVFSRDPARRFGPADVESLELLGAMAAAALVGIERARLDGALLAARTAQHEVHNRLALTVGYIELLSLSAELPGDLHAAAREALQGTTSAVAILGKLARVSQLAERDWGPDLQTTIDLDGSAH